MSYDLYFYKEKVSSLTEEQVAGYLQRNITFHIDAGERQWSYENEETGVAFTLDWYEPKKDPEELKQFEAFDKFDYLHFSCNINFCRSRYYGLEIFPIIENFIHELGLFVLNPQDEDNPSSPNKYPYGWLLHHWTVLNDGVSLEKFEEFKLNYFPPEKSEYAWEYLGKRKQLQENIGESHFVCGIFFFKNKRNNVIYTATTWTEHIPIIVPQVDYLIIQKKFKKLFRTVEESGFVKHSVIMEKFKQYIRTHDCGLEGVKQISLNDSSLGTDLFNSLKIECQLKEFGSLIHTGNFVNVMPN